MTENRIASLAVALLGLYWIGQGLQYVAVALPSLASIVRAEATLEALEKNALLYLTAVIAVAIPGLIFLLGRHRIAARLCPPTGDDDAQPLRAQGLQAAAFAVLGGYFAVHGFAQVLGMLLASPAFSALSLSTYFAWGSLVEGLFGVALFFGASTLSRWWSRMRGFPSGGTPPSSTTIDAG